MKTLVGKATLAAAFICAAPLLSFAQNLASQIGTVNRSVERLTLLPGPHLLSPARMTPTMMPAPLKLSPVQGQVQPSSVVNTSQGKSIYLPLFTSTTRETPSAGHRPSVTPSEPRPAPELLRFNSTIEAPPPSIRYQFRPAQKL